MFKPQALNSFSGRLSVSWRRWWLWVGRGTATKVVRMEFESWLCGDRVAVSLCLIGTSLCSSTDHQARILFSRCVPRQGVECVMRSLIICLQ